MVSSTVVFGTFSPDTFWEVASKYKVTVRVLVRDGLHVAHRGMSQSTAMVPVIMAKLSLIPIRAGLDLSNLEATLVGAAPIGRSVMAACYNSLELHNKQFAIRQLYGMTETSKSKSR